MASHTGLPLVYILLKDILHIQIYSGDKCLSVDCRFNNTFQVGIFIQIAILPSIDTDQAVIVMPPVPLLPSPLAKPITLQAAEP